METSKTLEAESTALLIGMLGRMEKGVSTLPGWVRVERGGW